MWVVLQRRNVSFELVLEVLIDFLVKDLFVGVVAAEKLGFCAIGEMLMSVRVVRQLIIYVPFKRTPAWLRISF